jgi:hypothetical protein
VTKGNGTSVKVDLVLVDAKDLHVGQRNNTESLVDLESINGGDVNLGVLQSLGYGQSGGSGKFRRVLLSIAPAKDLADRLQAVLLDSLLRGENEGSSSVRER